jgi:short-subunit dehydrogenase
LEALARDLRARYKIQTEVFIADLRQPSAPQEIFQFTQSKNLEINLVNNAGFGQYGEFHSVAVERLLEMVQVNLCGGAASDALVFARNGGETRRRCPDRCVHRLLSGNTWYFHLRRD